MNQRAQNPAFAYETHLVSAMFRPWAAELLSRANLRPGDRVLDVACGTGIMAREAVPLVGTDGAVTGVDISEKMLDVARTIPLPDGAAITWAQGDACALPYPTGAFDFVLCQQGLQFVPDQLAAVTEMRRVLVPGGTAVVSIWLGLEHHPVFAAIDAGIDRHLGETVGGPFSLGDAAALHTLFGDAGFATTTIDRVTRNVSFPSAQTFAQMMVASAAAVMPELGQADEETRASIIDTIAVEVEPDLAPFRDGDGLTFPMHANIVTATAP